MGLPLPSDTPASAILALATLDLATLVSDTAATTARGPLMPSLRQTPTTDTADTVSATMVWDMVWDTVAAIPATELATATAPLTTVRQQQGDHHLQQKLNTSLIIGQSVISVIWEQDVWHVNIENTTNIFVKSFSFYI